MRTNDKVGTSVFKKVKLRTGKKRNEKMSFAKATSGLSGGCLRVQERLRRISNVCLETVAEDKHQRGVLNQPPMPLKVTELLKNMLMQTRGSLHLMQGCRA